MFRWLRAASWVFFAAILYLILSEALWSWVRLPGLDHVGFTAVFVLFALTHCAVVEGPRRTGVFFAVSAIVSYAMEEAGVRSGLVYGAYHYSDVLGAKLGHVPVIIPLAWFMMIYPSWAVARGALTGVDIETVPGLTALAAAAALVMTAWDVVMDPGMAAGGVWIWEHGGAYFGVPRRNYLGWLLTTFLVYWIVGWLWGKLRRGPAAATRTYAALPVIVYAFFALRYVMANRFPALQVVALFAMGTPALIALLQVGLVRKNGAGEL